MRSDNQSLFALKKKACDRKANVYIKVATRERRNLKDEVATDWHVDHSVRLQYCM